MVGFSSLLFVSLFSNDAVDVEMAGEAIVDSSSAWLIPTIVVVSVVS